MRMSQKSLNLWPRVWVSLSLAIMVDIVLLMRVVLVGIRDGWLDPALG
jgi:hypothetical protein